MSKANGRWETLTSEGKKILLTSRESVWIVCVCETEIEAAHKVRELHEWANLSQAAPAPV